MSVIYDWIVASIECEPESGEYTDIVKVIHWVRTAASDGYNTSSYGSVTVPTPSPEGPFTPYSDLTKEDVEDWLNEFVDVTAVDANLAAQIEALKNPPLVTLPLPW